MFIAMRMRVSSSYKGISKYSLASNSAKCMRVRWLSSLEVLIHTFRNAGSEIRKVALSFHPSGFEEFFAEFAERLDAGDIDERIVQVGSRYGVTFLPPHALCQ